MVYCIEMTLKEKIVAILEERSFEVKDGASKMNCIEAADFEQVALDFVEILNRDFGVEIDADAEEKN